MIDPRQTPILVVDDYEAMRALLRFLLKQVGFTDIDEAPDGASALTMIRRKTYGLIISDLAMAPVSGLMILQEVRQDPKMKATPFIIVTAISDMDRVVAAREAGADDYIVKPFQVETLRLKVAGVLGLDRKPG